MMESLREIKDRISATGSMSKITSAMQMVASAKLTKFEQKNKDFQEYLKTLEAMMSKLTVKRHPFFQPVNNPHIGYLVITSDRGLAGGYNNNVLKLLANKERPYNLYMLGSKGFEYAKSHGLTVENPDIFVPDDVIYHDIHTVIDQMLDDFRTGKISKIVAIYTRYVSKILQVPTEKQILPIEPTNQDKSMPYEMEPSEEDVLYTLLPQYLEGVLYGAVLTSKLSEGASRMNSMQNATDNAVDIIRDLQLIYNRARQAHITEEINEIIGGASAI